MKTLRIFFSAFLTLWYCSGNSQKLFTASDLTAENLFTVNIEGPVVDDKGVLYVVNFQKNGTIGQVVGSEVSLFVSLPEGSTGNAIMIDSKRNMLVADFTGHNILKINKTTKAVAVFCHNDSFNQPNDITVNKKDQLFASDPNWKEKTGKLWRIDANGKSTLLMENMGTTNGIELSPDEKILYVNESIQRKVWAFEVDKKGNIGRKRLFFEFPDYGLDGMKCDNRGNLFITRYDKGTVVVLSPEGKLVREIQLKGQKPTNIAFGGKDGRACFITLQDRKCVETFRAENPGRFWK